MQCANFIIYSKMFNRHSSERFNTNSNIDRIDNDNDIHSNYQHTKEKHMENNSTSTSTSNESLMKYPNNIFIERQLTLEHCINSNSYSEYINKNNNIFVHIDRYIFLQYGIEFNSKNRPIIPIKGHMSVDISNPFAY